MSNEHAISSKYTLHSQRSNDLSMYCTKKERQESKESLTKIIKQTQL